MQVRVEIDSTVVVSVRRLRRADIARAHRQLSKHRSEGAVEEGILAVDNAREGSCTEQRLERSEWVGEVTGSSARRKSAESWILFI